MDAHQVTRTKFAVLIGFLVIALFAMLGFITNAAAGGNIIARWVLLIIFGAIAVLLASYAIGYVILIIVGSEKKQELQPPIPERQELPEPRSIPKRRMLKNKAARKKQKKKGR